MKSPHLPIWLFGLVLLSGGCKEKKSSPEMRHEVAEISEATREAYLTFVKSQLDEQRRTSLRERYYSAFPAIEGFLGIPGDLPEPSSMPPLLSYVLIVSVDSHGMIDIREQILGKVPVDYHAWIPHGIDAGDYLVGRVMPQGGWGIGGYSGRPAFCLPVSPDDSITYGFEGELKGSLESIRAYAAASP